MHIYIYIYIYPYFSNFLPNGKMDKEDVVHIYNGILFSHKKGSNWVICRDMDGPRDCQTDWSKSEKEKQISYINTYVGPRFLKVKSFFNYQKRAKVATFAMCLQTLRAHVLEAGWIQVLGDLFCLQFLWHLLLTSPMQHVSLALHMFASTYIYTCLHADLSGVPRKQELCLIVLQILNALYARVNDNISLAWT